ncbi:MAG TPA: thioesterase family protein [Candidatus Acidoferrum sp.]|nr:thioesterase family protein [Candidatus Acidoferrum sp.]
MKPLAVGKRARFEQIVGPSQTADKFGNPGVQVLATPVVCHWFESTSVMAIQPQLEPGEATVGTRLTIEHLKATPMGMRVTVDAEVTAVDGRRISFRIEAHDERALIARGTHERFVVDLDRFLEGVRAKEN